MSDLTVSGGGQIAVSTEELAAAAVVLQGIQDGIGEAADAVHAAVGGCGGSGVQPWAAPAWDALAALQCAQEQCQRLREALRQAAEEYGAAEHTLDALFALCVESLAGLAGLALPLLALASLAAVPALLLTGAAAQAFGVPPAQLTRGLGGLAAEHQGLLRDPRVIALVRAAISGADNALLAALGVSPGVAGLLDDRALGWFGLHGAAALAIGLAGPNALKETPVAVRRTGQMPTTAPSGFGDLAARVPAPAAGGSQVRIERYDVRGEQRWIVYVGGTLDLALTPGREPWDNTSNLQGVARLDPASLRATQQAMEQAGVRPGEKVMAVGHSQGGIVATAIASDRRYAAAELVTFGSPTAGLAVPGVTDVAVEHRDDIVPALGGVALHAGQGGLDRIVVRTLSEPGPIRPDAAPIDGHHMERYRDTARALDTAHDPRLTAAREKIVAFTASDAEKTGTATTWRGERFSPGGGGSAGAG